VVFKGAYEWPEDGPFGSPLRGLPSATHQLLFCSIFEGRKHTHVFGVGVRLLSTNECFWTLYILREFLSIKWMVPTLILGSIVIQKTIFMSLQISGFTIHMFYLPEWHLMATKKTMCDLVPKGPPKKIKKGRQNEISTTCWLFFNAKVTNGSRKVHGMRMALACRSFGSSCGPYKAHETYAMFLH
jgi:hypothetical protein